MAISVNFDKNGDYSLELLESTSEDLFISGVLIIVVSLLNASECLFHFSLQPVLGE